MLVAVATLAHALPANAAITSNVTTISGDVTRSGWDSGEPGLSPAFVGSGAFGQVFSTAVQGQVYAQPLVVNGIVIVVTEHDMAYGIDAAGGAVRWQRSLGTPEPNTNFPGGFEDITPEVGITSTPVVDTASNVVYTTVHTWDGVNHSSGQWFLHALDVGTGTEKAGWPVQLGGVAGNDSTSTFDPTLQNQRPGLLLLGGFVYSAFASYGDFGAYKGWIIGVSESTQAQTLWTSETSPGLNGGIWMSGSGLMSDGPGRIFIATGNGDVPPPGPASTPSGTLGNSVVRLTQNADGSLVAADRFSPNNAAALNAQDLDLGSGGPIALPDSMGVAGHPHLTVLGSKEGRVYLLDRDNLGGEAPPSGTDAAVAETGPGSGVFAHAAVWPGDGGWIYLTTGYLTAYQIGSGGGTFSLNPVASGGPGYRAVSPLVTSNGTTNGSALVWALTQPLDGSPGAELRAYAAVPQNGAMPVVFRAPIGTATKFSVPVASNGRVYAGTLDGHLVAFGAKAWQVAAAPYGGDGSSLTEVSATGPSDVWAAGSYTLSGVRQYMVEHFDGTAWTILPTPGAGVSSIAGGIAAVSPTDVWVVGSYNDSGGVSSPLAEHWNGTAWQTILPPRAGARAQLNGVVAVSSSDVWAVGTWWDSAGNARTLTDHWNGTAWSYVGSPFGGNTSVLNDVSATASNDVWAVGAWYDASGNARNLTEHWDGTQWTLVAGPYGGAQSVLNATAMISSGDAWALGTWYDAGHNARPMADHWDGTAWTVTALPIGGVSSVINGIAAAASADVWAVGTYTDASAVEHPFTEHWNGFGWRVVVPPTGGIASELNAAVAVSGSDCRMVGTWFAAASTPRSLVEQFEPA
jgi:PQQ-like domain